MQLTYHTDYALRLLIYLVMHPGETVGTRVVAEHYGISPNHLIKVAKQLTQGGWLLASRGAGGGVRLAEHTLEAKVGEIVRFTEATDLVECFSPGSNSCPISGHCMLKPMLFEARQAFFDVLDSYTVRDLAWQTAGAFFPSSQRKVVGKPSISTRGLPRT